MTLRIRSWGKWQSGLLYAVGKSRVKNGVDPTEEYSMSEVRVSAKRDTHLKRFAELVGRAYADVYWYRLLMHVAKESPLTGVVTLDRKTLGPVALSAPWDRIGPTTGARIYESLVTSTLCEELADEQVAPATICCTHRRYLCQKKDGACAAWVPHQCGTRSGGQCQGHGQGQGSPPTPPPGESPASAGREPSRNGPVRKVRPRDRERLGKVLDYLVKTTRGQDQAEAVALRAQHRSASPCDDEVHELLEEFAWVTPDRLARLAKEAR